MIKVKGNIHDIQDKKYLNLMNIILDVLMDAPPNHVHIIVLPPGMCHAFRQRPSELTVASEGIRPSSTSPLPSSSHPDFVKSFPTSAPYNMGITKFEKLQANEKQEVHWNQPPLAAHPIPPALLHQIFGEFIDDCDHLETTEADNETALLLPVGMAVCFPGKED